MRTAVSKRRPATESNRLPETIGKFIEARTAHRWQSPTHLKPLTDALEAAHERPIRVLVNVPPQHYKTETILHGLALLLARDPYRTNGYASYATELSRSKSEKARSYARSLGIRINPRVNRLEEWRTHEGGGLLATGVGGPLTGQGVDGVLVIDDPVKNREQAESAVYRKKTRGWFDTVATTRVHPRSSIIVCQTRWHTDDLSGQLEAEGWADLVINLPAVTGATGLDRGQRGPGGEWARPPAFLGNPVALCPADRPIDFLALQCRSMGGWADYDWVSLYQQQPRPLGGYVFKTPTLCDFADLPSVGREALGVDLNYTAKTSSDYGGYLALREFEAKYYVIHVERKQQRTPEAAQMLRAAAAMYPGAPMTWHAAGPEIGTADLMEGVPLIVKAATTDKLTRSLSQGVPAAWNIGDIVTPRDAPWSAEFIREVTTFTGKNDAYDDQVDMLGSAYSALVSRALIIDSGKPRQSKGARAAY